MIQRAEIRFVKDARLDAPCDWRLGERVEYGRLIKLGYEQTKVPLDIDPKLAQSIVFQTRAGTLRDLMVAVQGSDCVWTRDSDGYKLLSADKVDVNAMLAAPEKPEEAQKASQKK